MMKNVLIKDLIREIYKTRGRFLSILAIIAIGCGFFAGVKSSCPDMKLTAEKYYNDTNLADLHLMSTLGLEDIDIENIKDTLDIRGIMPAYSVDAFIISDNLSSITAKIMSYDPESSDMDPNYLNRPVLQSGRMPENKGECVLEDSTLYDGNVEIGSTISVSLKSDDITETLCATEFEVVGFVKSSNYINFEHGSTLIGDGKVDSYMFVTEDSFCLDVYTDVYITLEETRGLSPFEDEYRNIIDEKKEYLENHGQFIAQRRYDALLSDINEQIDDAKEELAKGESEAKEELAKAKQELDDALKQINDGRAEYESAVQTFKTEISKAESEIAANKVNLQEARKQYEQGLNEYNDGVSKYEAEEPQALKLLTEYENKLSDLRLQISQAETQISSVESTVNSANTIIEKYSSSYCSQEEIPQEELVCISQIAHLINNGEQNPQGVDSLFIEYITTQDPKKKAELNFNLAYIMGTVKDGIDTQKNDLNLAKESEKQLVAGIESGYAELDKSKRMLSETKVSLDAAKAEIENGEYALAEAENNLAKEKINGQNELDNANRQLSDAESEYENGIKEYEKAENDAKIEIEEGRQKIKDAEDKIEDIPDPELYVLDRDQNPGYSGYQDDAEKVDAIAAVFPFFFVLVAALVCSTTMSRMVEEQRIQMGTLKALGYSNGKIIAKYIIYAVSASILGSVIGLSIGFQLFPKVIINAYGAMYRFPEPITPFRWDYALACTIVGILCTGITALCVSYRSLKIVPSQLMRPKAPKMGKRVLLERVGFIWKHLSFLYKVTIRNIGRYKKRSFMTIVGIAGCTALILTGFGLRYAIGVIADRQFTRVFITDATVITNEDIEDFESLHQRVDKIEGVKETSAAIYKTVDVSGDSGIISANLIVPQDKENFSNFIILKNPKTGKPITLGTDGAVINEKLAKLLNLSVGDELTVNLSDGRDVKVRIADISENYALNYVYMTPEVYSDIYKTDKISYNCFFLNKEDGAISNQISERLLDNSEILGISFTEDTSATFLETVQTLNSIVWVIILSAGALAFIVMYNLININVNERRHELATIKVLGFYDKEVSAYIYRENNISVFVGIIIGLIAGVFLERFVVATAEVDIVMFATDMNVLCYVLSAVITALFAAIVTIALHVKLKKINMAESMKAIE